MCPDVVYHYIHSPLLNQFDFIPGKPNENFVGSSKISTLTFGSQTQRCYFKSRSSQQIFRCCYQCKNENKLVFHISEDGSYTTSILSNIIDICDLAGGKMKRALSFSGQVTLDEPLYSLGNKWYCYVFDWLQK